jgi:transcription elongation factor GreB
MSRGFVKEDDQEEAPFIPPRAPLPDGATNHVTPRGMRLLLVERARLEDERANAQGGDDERRREKAVIDGRLALLNERIATARPVEPGTGPPTDVRFGTTVTVIYRSGPQQGMERSFTITGVDEASVAEHRFAFTAPIARALMGRRVGEHVAGVLGPAQQELEVLAIGWPGAEE